MAEIEKSFSYALLGCAIFYILFPLLGLIKSRFFMLYIAPVLSALGSEEGIPPDDDGHSWKATILMVVFLFSSIALLIGAIFQIEAIVYTSVVGIVVYSILAPKIYQKESCHLRRSVEK